MQLYCPNMSQAGKNKWQVQVGTSTEETIENLSLYIILYYKGQPYIYLVISMIQSSLVYEAYLHDDIGPIGHINNPMKGGRWAWKKPPSPVYCMIPGSLQELVQHVPPWYPKNTTKMVFFKTNNFYTGLSPHEPCVSSGFVFTSDQVCSQGSLVIRSMVGMYFSHQFGVYSCIFGVFPRMQWFPKLYTYVPILWNIDTAWKHYGNQFSNPSNSSMLHDHARKPMFWS